MYRYDEFDYSFVKKRVQQFRTQVERRLSGALSEDEFKPLRLMNGVYLQLHAYMLRIAIPYGLFSSAQMRTLAMIADRYDRGYGHITTRQNIQFNWPKLAEIPDLLDDLAESGMHAIQTSGNCIRNVTCDPWAGAAADEVFDPRPIAEILRQWSSLHPEFVFLPRKFKIALSGAKQDRAAVYLHDLGIYMVQDKEGNPGCQIVIGGGQGRTPMIAKTLDEFIPQHALLARLEAVMRVYNRYGRRDNKYKARIKILVHELGLEAFRKEVDQEFARIDVAACWLNKEEEARINSYFAPPDLVPLPEPKWDEDHDTKPGFQQWLSHNTHPHKVAGYRVVTISLKATGAIPGDIHSQQMRALADLADRFALGEIRATHTQNLVLAHVKARDLAELWQELAASGLASANHGLIGDLICCPGLDYCGLATARSIPLAQQISRRFGDPARQKLIGEMAIKISGCINACGHHHVGHIGILGLEKSGQESYQITLGGHAGHDASIGERTGPGFAGGEVVDAIERVIDRYLELRKGSDEPFLQTYRRLGKEPFQQALYQPQA
ncbi:MAG: nitrite/sulfite reductase [Pseudomonadota bacterium]